MTATLPAPKQSATVWGELAPLQAKLAQLAGGMVIVRVGPAMGVGVAVGPGVGVGVGVGVAVGVGVGVAEQLPGAMNGS